MRELVATGAHVNDQDEQGETALMAAAKNGHTDCVNELLLGSAALNILDNEGNTALIHAVKGGTIECAKTLITEGADVNKGTVPPLICSVRSKCFDITNELLKAGVYVNGTDADENTALIEAVCCGKNTIVQSFLHKGADINAENRNGFNAIHLAAVRSHQEFNMQQLNLEISKENGNLAKSASEFAKVVDIHLKGGILLNEIGESLNPQAIDLEPPEYQKPDFHILKMLLAAGAEMEETDMFTLNLLLTNVVRNYIRNHLKKVHPKSNLYFTVSKLTSLPKKLQAYLLYDTQLEMNKVPEMTTDEQELFSQTSDQDEQLIQSLICRGVDVNVKNEKGMTPLMVASLNGDGQLIEKLLDAGADVNCYNSVTGDTSLILASEKGQTTCVQKLLDYHANINIQGKNGDTAVISAARNGHEKCLQVLINIGANLNIQNNNGNTALIAAVHRFQFQSAVQLINSGADVNLMDNQGNTAIVLAARKGQGKFIKELITAGANVNHFDKNLRITALVTAACQGHFKCLNLLIQSGADLNIPDVNGKTALMRTAELVSSGTCFSLLLKAGAQIDTTILADVASKVIQKTCIEEKQNSASCRLSTGMSNKNYTIADNPCPKFL